MCVCVWDYKDGVWKEVRGEKYGPSKVLTQVRISRSFSLGVQ